MSDGQRRQSKRFKVNWSSRLLFPDKRIVAARIRDVSSGGVCFEFEEQIPDGAEINIEFTPMIKGKRYVIRAKGLITFSMIMGGVAGFCHGLKFTFVPKEQFAELSEILKSFE